MNKIESVDMTVTLLKEITELKLTIQKLEARNARLRTTLRKLGGYIHQEYCDAGDHCEWCLMAKRALDAEKEDGKV